jgi:magnesium-transporting ATPase (P-type)
MNLDGETNLKERFAISEKIDENRMDEVQGEVVCDAPNENLEKWDAKITYDSSWFKNKTANISNLLLRGTFMRNTETVVGIVVYTGMDTKIMRNLKKPPHKVSNIMRLMNNMLYSVFAFQFMLILVFAGLYLQWTENNLSMHFYLQIDTTTNQASAFFV